MGSSSSTCVASCPCKGRQQIERYVVATFQIAESMGLKGDFRQ